MKKETVRGSVTVRHRYPTVCVRYRYLGEEIPVQRVQGQDKQAGLLCLRREVLRLGHRTENLEIAVAGHEALVKRIDVHAKVVLGTPRKVEAGLHATVLLAPPRCRRQICVPRVADLVVSFC